MKITFEPQDSLEFERLHRSLDMALALWDINQLFRDAEAYIEHAEPTATEMMEWYNRKIGDILFENKINIEDLTE